jgi:hypothetical protein
MANPAGDHSGASYFYNVDDPYAPSSQQRLSQAASVLLPHPVNLHLNQGWRDSRLRHSGAPAPAATQSHELRGKNEEQEEGREEAAKTDVAVVDDHASSRPATATNNTNNMEDLAAGVGVGLGLGPGSGYQAAAQQAIKENGNHNHNHTLNLNHVKTKNRGSAMPLSHLLAPPSLRR